MRALDSYAPKADRVNQRVRRLASWQSFTLARHGGLGSQATYLAAQLSRRLLGVKPTKPAAKRTYLALTAGIRPRADVPSIGAAEEFLAKRRERRLGQRK